MRFETPIFFQQVTTGAYNASTGNYDEDIVIEDKRYASVMDTATETMMLLYGAIRQSSRVVVTQTHYTKAFDRIRIGGKLYRVDRSRMLRSKHVFVVSEVQ